MTAPESEAPVVTGDRASLAVAAGILASRLFGLVRQRVFSHFLGVGPEADAFNAAFRIPNLLQNLFGEGALSASFIPVYAKLRTQGDDDARQRLAGAVLGLLGLGAALVSLFGALGAPWLVDLVAPGFVGAKRDLTVHLVRILFPGAGLLVLSAWCLGVLNSHGKFLLSYASPVIWNVAMIGALLFYGSGTPLPQLVVLIAWASLTGSALQVLVQWPAVHAVLGAWRISLGSGVASAQTVLRNFVPAFIGRGVTQLSAFLDTWIASRLIDGSVTILSNAQVLYMLPISLFGMSSAAAQLPAMAGEAGLDEAGRSRLRLRLEASLNRVVFFVLPSAMALIALGNVVGGAVFRSGRFGATETTWLWGTLAASGVGLLAATTGRLYATTLYALQDTRTPQRFAIARVIVSAILGLTGALWAGRALGLDPRWNVALLALGSAIAAWVEWALLRHSVRARIGTTRLRAGLWWRLAVSTTAAAAVALGAQRAMGSVSSLVAMLLVISLFGATYLVVALSLGVAEARAIAGVVGNRWR
ncbi:MAG: murein biosynthesis integral membrane protein MurJ [Gemmatimonadaceae bacterium]